MAGVLLVDGTHRVCNGFIHLKAFSIFRRNGWRFCFCFVRKERTELWQGIPNFVAFVFYASAELGSYIPE